MVQLHLQEHAANHMIIVVLKYVVVPNKSQTCSRALIHHRAKELPSHSGGGFQSSSVVVTRLNGDVSSRPDINDRSEGT